jgi:hypothetical protein
VLRTSQRQKHRFVPTTRLVCASIALATSLALLGCGGASTLPPPSAPRVPSGLRPAPPTPDAAWVQFKPEARDQHWTLLAKDNSVLCELPCARWISATSGEFLQYDIPGTNRALQVDLPTERPNPGTDIVAIARTANGSKATGRKLFFGGALLLFADTVFFGLLDQFGNETGDIVLGVMAVASIPLMATGLYILLKSHPADVQLRSASASPRPTFTLGPGFAEATTSPTGLHLVLTPLGASGTF